MATKTVKTTSNGLKMTREKETFKFEGIFNNDNGEDVKCYVKCSVNYERLTYKCQPVVSLVHGWNSDVADTFNDLISAGVDECKTRLAKYREEAGIGTQTDLFDGEAAQSN